MDNTVLTKMPKFLGYLAFVGLISLHAPHSQAQRASSSLNGVVTDPVSAVVINITVTATNTATGFSRTSISNAAGVYSFTELSLASTTSPRGHLASRRP